MPNNNFRYRDLERSTGKKPIKKPAESSAPSKKENTTNTSVIASDLDRLMNEMRNLEKKLESMTMVHSLRSKVYPNIEYFYLDDLCVLIHDFEKDTYIFGGNTYSDLSFLEMKTFVESNYSNVWMSGKISADRPYIEDFCNIYATIITQMLRNLATSDLVICRSGEDLKNIHDVLEDLLSKYEEDTGETPVPSVEDDEEDEDPEEEETEEEQEEEMVSIQQLVEEEDQHISIDEIQALDSTSPDTSSSNLRKYAEEIDSRISDDDAMEVIRKAREAKRNRAFQQNYVSSK